MKTEAMIRECLTPDCEVKRMLSEEHARGVEEGKNEVMEALRAYAEERLDMHFALDILCKQVINEFIESQSLHNRLVDAFMDKFTKVE